MKTAVIVGAGKGMGNHIAERFAKEGFRVVLMARQKSAVEAYAAVFVKRAAIRRMGKRRMPRTHSLWTKRLPVSTKRTVSSMSWCTMRRSCKAAKRQSSQRRK